MCDLSITDEKIQHEVNCVAFKIDKIVHYRVKKKESNYSI